MAPFGMNKNVAIGEQEGYQLCYKVFDILFVKN